MPTEKKITLKNQIRLAVHVDYIDDYVNSIDYSPSVSYRLNLATTLLLYFTEDIFCWYFKTSFKYVLVTQFWQRSILYLKCTIQ